MKNKKKTGFTLIMSLLVVSVVLVVGLGVFDIVLRETRLAGIGRESQKAFYAADTGVECAVYWDLVKKMISADNAYDIACAGQAMNVGGNGNPVTFNVSLENGACAKVEIDKSSSAETVISSRGYNVSCDSSSSYKVERGVRKTVQIQEPE